MIEQTMELLVSGRVQGVGFRYFALQTAQRYQIHGYVQNRVNGSVKIIAQGKPPHIQAFIAAIQAGPTRGFVDSIERSPITAAIQYQDFHVRY
jgi:acylphosphatase